MKIIEKGFRPAVLLIGALMICNVAMSQGIKDMRINEVLVKNTDSYEDDYGQKIGWIELYNTGYSDVELGGAYLTVKYGDKNLTYRIPKGDARTHIPPQGYVIFFAEGTSTKGTFHTNFTLDSTGYLALYDQSGKGEPISEIRYNVADQKENLSMGWLVDDDGKSSFIELHTTTPLGPNDTEEKVPQHEKFRQSDPSGFTMAITAMSVVFAALVVLYLIFRTIGKYNVRLANKKELKAKGISESRTKASSKEEDINGEVIAAIAIALQRWEEYVHDVESTVITINRVARTYSPWSSKLYGLTQTPNKSTRK